MQNKRLFTTEMDFSAVDKPPIFLGTVKQLDGVTLKITPLAEYNPMTMIGVTPKLYAKKPNGEFVYQDVDIDVDLSTSQITIQCKNFMFSDVGTVEMEIELYDDDNYLRTSPTFEIDVTQKLNQLEMEDLKEGIHISLLEELMDYVAESKDYVERFKELLSEFGDDDTIMLENLIVVRMMLETLSSEVDRLENTIAQAQEYEFEMANQEIARVAAEEKRVGAEALRVQAETNRVNEETKRKTTEQDRVSAENTRVSNENTREANEVVRQDNENQRIEAETQRQNRYNSFITEAEANASNFENYTNTAKVKEEERKANELERKSQETQRVSNENERVSNEETRKANEVVREENETSRQDVFENKVSEVDEKISEINATKDNFVSSINTKVDNKISEIEVAKSDMTTTVSNKIDEVENRFNSLTSKQQQDAEVIDARDGETSLKARLDRDIEKAKQVYVNAEGNHISTDSSSGYLKDVEILGNTIQDASNLADIRSVGGTVEGQELYEIPVVSCGKNLWDGVSAKGRLAISGKFSILTDNAGHCTLNPIRIYPNTSYRVTKSDWVVLYNKDLKVTRYVAAYSAFTALVDEVYCGFYTVEDTVDFNMAQLEEGTVATPYEPYVEDKLTILSPVQLEKVGDVRDRIIEKDGVWGVEKNVETVVLNGSESWKHFSNSWGTLFDAYVLSDKIAGSTNLITDTIPVFQFSSDETSFCCMSSGNISDRTRFFIKNPPNIQMGDVTGFKTWLSENNVLVKYPLTTPQFIPLPHDQQIKLRTFANKTNISFLTEIEGTIKAQVPKSLGATVNTHTEQISNLNKELDRVKKLEESTVSTVETESDFTTVTETSNGYFEDVKLEGKTLVNLLPSETIKNEQKDNENFIVTGDWLQLAIWHKTPIKANATYTLIVDIIEKPSNVSIRQQNNSAYIGIGTSSTDNLSLGRNIITITTSQCDRVDNMAHNYLGFLCEGFEQGQRVVISKNMMLLEGDHTQNPPSYFEGLKSVSEDADEIVVLSSNGNLFPTYYKTWDTRSNSIYSDDYVVVKSNTSSTSTARVFIMFEGNTTYTLTGTRTVANTGSDVGGGISILGYTGEDAPVTAWNPTIISSENVNHGANVTKQDFAITFKTKDVGMHSLALCFTARGNVSSTISGEAKFENLRLIKGDKERVKNQLDKKRLLYYNEETQSWEKPVLREWDSIEKHADGKYYYHQRSGEVVFDGSEGWRINNITWGKGFSRYCTVIDSNIIKNNIASVSSAICDKLIVTNQLNSNGVNGIHLVDNEINIVSNIENDLAGFKAWLQANNVTVVYQLAQEKVYECTNIDLITYSGETNYVVGSGVIAPKSILKVHNNISNVVSLLQKKVSLLESNVKASQEVQDMMILETDMRMLDMELALMEHMPITLNLGVDMMLRSATYFNFLKKHIENETYEKEYLENVMNKYLATNRLTQEEYDKLYKLLYPPVYDIELPIEY